jgi:hypothetical protein
MEAIVLVLRTGMQWRAVKATGICGYSSAYRRFREWLAAEVFLEFWRQGLLAHEALRGIDWKWLALDGPWAKPRNHTPTPDGFDERQLREALTVRIRRRVRRDTTVSFGGEDYEMDAGHLAGRVVTLCRCLVDVQQAPWVEHEDRPGSWFDVA